MTTEHPDDRRIELLSRGARTIPVPPLDVQQVLSAARRRRANRFAAAAGVAAVLLAVPLVAVAAGGDRSPSGRGAGADPAPTADAATDAQEATLPAPPDGTKWVGQDGVLVAVPVDWAVTENPCGVDAAGYVFDGTSEPSVRCVGFGGQVATVRFDPLRDYPQLATSGCTADVPGTCVGSRVFDAGSMAAQVSVRVTGDGAEEQVEAILDSAIPVPDGWTTVPFAWGERVPARVAAMESEGLEVDVVDRTGINPYVVSLVPQGGTVVPVGTAVSLAPGDTPPLDLTCAPEEQAATDLDAAGPGRRTPAEAVAPYADGLALTTDTGPGPLGSGRTAVVSAADEVGVVTQVFAVTERDDGWWPDSYTSCG